MWSRWSQCGQWSSIQQHCGSLQCNGHKKCMAWCQPIPCGKLASLGHIRLPADFRGEVTIKLSATTMPEKKGKHDDFECIRQPTWQLIHNIMSTKKGKQQRTHKEHHFYKGFSNPRQSKNTMKVDDCLGQWYCQVLPRLRINIWNWFFARMLCHQRFPEETFHVGRFLVKKSIQTCRFKVFFVAK